MGGGGEGGWVGGREGRGEGEWDGRQGGWVTLITVCAPSLLLDTSLLIHYT